MKQKLIEQQGAIEKLRITVDFYTYQYIINKKWSEVIQDLKNAINLSN